MARLCAACRQPVGRNPQDHDCPADDLDPEATPDDGGEAA